MKSLLSAELYQYLCQHTAPEPPVLQTLRERGQALGLSQEMTPPDQVAFLSLLLKLSRATRVLEVGTSIGYTTLSLALHLPEGGQIWTLELDPQKAEIAQHFWEQAGCRHKITLKQGPALLSLQELSDSVPETFDLIYIDADKRNYPTYYERALSLLRPGGLLAIDNTISFGGSTVLDQHCPKSLEKGMEAVRSLNETLVTDARVQTCLLPIGLGLTLCLKHPSVTLSTPQ